MRLDAFLTLNSTDLATSGETTDALFAQADPKPIEILWFSQIVTRGRYEDRGIGRNQQSNSARQPQISFMSIIKPLDETSPLLLKAIGQAGDDNGYVYQTGKIETYFYRGNSTENHDAWTRVPYFEIAMTNLNVMRVQLVSDPRVTSIASGDAEVYYQLPDDLAGMGPMEIIDLSFQTATWTYKGERVTAATATSEEIPPPPAG